MAEEKKWTVGLIYNTLSVPEVKNMFMTELDQAGRGELLSVFDKWQTIAQDILRAVRKGRELAELEARGEEIPGQWIDGTERILKAAEEVRMRVLEGKPAP